MQIINMGEAKNSRGAKVPLFVSKDLGERHGKVLVLIQGSGEVRPGIWARSVCVNDDLDLGTMLP